jgi:hypothetical protein
MKTNMGSIDRLIRIVIAVVVALLWFTKVITGVFAVILLVVSIVFVLTSIFGVCPLYSLIGFSTKKKQ